MDTAKLKETLFKALEGGKEAEEEAWRAIRKLSYKSTVYRKKAA